MISNEDFIDKEFREADELIVKLHELVKSMEVTHPYEGADLMKDYLHTVYALAEKEHMIHTRLSLSDDFLMQAMKTNMEEALRERGMKTNEHPLTFFGRVKNDALESLKALDPEAFTEYENQS